MKKFTSLFLSLIFVTSLLLIPTTTEAASKTKNKFKTSDNGSLYVNKKYIFATQKGIYVKNKISGKTKKISGKKSIGYTPSLLSDGKTVYFTVTGKSTDPYNDYRYTIYSVKTNGKKLKKIKTLDNGNYFTFVTYYKGYLYYCSGIEHYASSLYKMNLSNKAATKVREGSSNGFYFNGEIYCNRAHSDVSESTLYRYNPEKGTITKFKDSAPFDVYTYPYFVTEKMNYEKGPTSLNIYTSTNGKTFKKSKKLPSSEYVLYASGKTKYAVLEKEDTLYKFTLKTGKHKKISGLNYSRYGYYNIIKIDIKNDAPYFVYQTEDTITVQKLSGTKAVNCKISGKSSVSAKGITDCNIAGGYLAVNKNGAVKTYKLK